MTAVYVLRHPQTTWNVASRYQGRLEAPLSDLGWRQVDATAATMAERPLAAIYSSPMLRARCLASAVAEAHGLTFVVDERLTEIAMGPWEGKTRDEIRVQYPEIFRQWYARPDLVQFPYGESMHDVCARARSALEDILRRHPESEICLVTHSAVVQALVVPALGMDLRFMHRISASNAGITTLNGTEPPGRVSTLNAVSHLDRIALDPCATVRPRRRAS